VTTFRTPNEMRIKHGDSPFPDDKKWADVPLNQLIYQAEGLAGGMGGGPGGPGGGEGERGGAGEGEERESPSDDEIREAGAAVGEER
jgi:hypothetical protein